MKAHLQKLQRSNYHKQGRKEKGSSTRNHLVSPPLTMIRITTLLINLLATTSASLGLTISKDPYNTTKRFDIYYELKIKHRY